MNEMQVGEADPTGRRGRSGGIIETLYYHQEIEDKILRSALYNSIRNGE